ncbi:hypothetical protein HDV06_004499 [Boothiomyces sp. JEL0866]|nr:hypothetical protein HDV06_004499 [Boothiomyces sp. JEL0866]
MQILKAFSSASWLSRKMLDYMAAIEIFLYCLTMFGYMVYLRNLGRPTENSILAMWQAFGVTLFILVTVMFETFVAIYMTRNLLKIRSMGLFEGAKISAKSRKAAFQLIVLLTVDISIIWIGIVLFAVSSFMFTGSIQTSLSTIGGVMGVGHVLTIKRVSNRKTDITTGMQYSFQSTSYTGTKSAAPENNH